MKNRWKYDVGGFVVNTDLPGVFFINSAKFRGKPPGNFRTNKYLIMKKR